MIDFFVPAAYTELSNSILTQRESVFYSGTITLLLHNLQQVAGDVSCDEIDSKDTSDPTHTIKLFDVSTFYYMIGITSPHCYRLCIDFEILQFHLFIQRKMVILKLLYLCFSVIKLNL